MSIYGKRLLRVARLIADDLNDEAGVRFSLKEISTVDAIKPVGLNPDAILDPIGMACISGIFLDEGFSYELGNDFAGRKAVIPTLTKPDTTLSVAGYLAVSRFFGLDEQDYTFLFRSASYPSSCRESFDGALTAAKRIEKFANERIGVE